jgi:hypothetical protein
MWPFEGREKRPEGVQGINSGLDKLSHPAIIPPEIRSPIPLPGRRVWSGDFEPHFLKERWGFFFLAVWANYQIVSGEKGRNG